VHRRVPVVVGVLLQRAKHDGQHSLPVLRHQRDDILVVPQEQAALSDLRSAYSGGSSSAVSACMGRKWQAA
jgi:hypothetical protein